MGAIAQGVGQALIEQIVYDRDGGQLVTGSFMDYGMPRADDMPPVNERAASGAGDDQRVGGQGRRRSRHHRRARRDHERDRRCASERRRREARHAGAEAG